MTTEAKESDVKAALLMKTAIRTNGGLESACIVTASEEGVFFANAVNLTSGLKMTIEEWNRVVEFVDSQMLGDSERQIVNWDEIDESYKYAAVDEDGSIFVYRSMPTPSKKFKHWNAPITHCYKVGQSKSKYFPSWQNSLVKRPGV